MREVIAATAMLAVLVLGGWGCASTGSISADRYSAGDLAELQYESMYEFLDAHSDVRVAESAADVPLTVRTRQTGDLQSPPAGGGSGSGGPGDLGGGGGEGDVEPPDQRAIGSGSYTRALLYIDDSEVASPRERLRELTLDEVESVRILRPTEASARFGGSGDTGAVAIVLKN